MAYCGAAAEPLAHPPPVRAWTGAERAQFLIGNGQCAGDDLAANDGTCAPSRWWTCGTTGDRAYGGSKPVEYILCADDEGDQNSDSGDDQDDGDDWDDDDDSDDYDSGEEDERACPVAPAHTPYAYGYSFIEGLMPAESFDALVRPERRLVVTVGGVPVALDAAEVERAGNIGRPLVTPIGSCALGPVDIERAHEAEEALYQREGLRRFFTTAPVNAAIEAAAPALGIGAGTAADIAGGGILAGLLGALL
nr:hypothetical protein [Pandoravirus belohorizontensis]